MPTAFSRLAVGVAAIFFAGAAVAAEPVPRRIVSINLCADELLVTLADPGQVASLSVTATDPRLSYVAEAALAYRHDAADAETAVDLDPDLVLAGRFTKRATRDMLTALGYRVVLLDPARSVAESIAQIRRIAALVGHPERGEALVARIEAAQAAAAAAVPPGAPPTVAVYQRRGYVTGGDTLTGDLLATAGFANTGGALAGKSGGFVPLERLVADPPDYLVGTSFSANADDQGSALLAHPAIAALYPPEKGIRLPENLTVCGGPSLPEALDWLAAEARRVAAGS
ncbi:MAG TPA: ABC transporter substrate-binding protein [Bauldia sp.]|nr:ABC transporter substrate-binding protein [Bauldia sp.]